MFSNTYSITRVVKVVTDIIDSIAASPMHDETVICFTITLIANFHCRSQFVDTDSIREIKGKFSNYL